MKKPLVIYILKDSNKNTQEHYKFPSFLLVPIPIINKSVRNVEKTLRTDSNLTSQWSAFLIEPSRSHVERKVVFVSRETKKRRLFITDICGTRFECDRNRVRPPPRAPASCRAGSMFCRSRPSWPHPEREPLSPPTPLDPRRPSRRRAFGEYGSALTILPSEPPRVSTGMIYAAAFHIFHCFQVFGSICKIKFVMREHSALSPSSLPPSSTPRVTPSPAHPRRRHLLLRARESTHMADRSISSRTVNTETGCSEKILAWYKTSVFVFQGLML